MNIIERFGNLWAPPALKAASHLLPIIAPWIRATFFDESFYSLNHEAYKKNSAVFACISAIAFAFIEPPLKWYDDEREELPDHLTRRLVIRPNDTMGEGELLLHTITYLAIGGNAYWHKVRNGQGGVIGLKPYHIGSISPVPGRAESWIDGYEYDDGTGQKTPVPKEDIVHFKWPSVDMGQPWVAMPPLLPALREVATDNEAIRYLKAILQNDAVPRMVMHVPADSNLDLENEDKQARLKAQWRAKYGGDNRGDIAIVTGGAKVERVSLNLTELAFDAIHRIPESRITAALRVPAIIAGLNTGLENATYSNFGEAKEQFTRGTLGPLWNLCASEIAADSDLNPGGDFVSFEMAKVQALQEDTNEKWARLTAALNAGGITVNDFLRGVGLPALDTGGDIRLIDGSRIIINVSEPKETPVKEIFAYHIENGAVSLNEVRAGLGLPPVSGGDVPLATLGSTQGGATIGGSVDGKGKPIISYKNHLTRAEQKKHDACLSLEKDGLIYRYKEDDASIEWRPTEATKWETKETDTPHTGQWPATYEDAEGHEGHRWAALTCPICGNVGVNVFDDHKGLAVCPACTCTFDPAIEGDTIGQNGKH